MILAFHPETKQQFEELSKSSSQAILLSGPVGIGKHTLALRLGQDLLDVTDFLSQPSGLVIGSDKNKNIGIEDVRKIDKFLKLKVVSQKPINRIVIIENADTMSLEAQNALLKTLEEPPTGSVIILTATSPQSLLPTVISRLRVIQINRPEKPDLRQVFASMSEQDFDKAYLMSSGLPGTMDALINEDGKVLSLARDTARKLLTNTTGERLALVDELSKNRELSFNLLNVLLQMAEISLSKDSKNDQVWQKVMNASYEALDALGHNAQLKLVLIRLMLSM